MYFLSQARPLGGLHRASPVPFRGSSFTSGLHPPDATPQGLTACWYRQWDFPSIPSPRFVAHHTVSLSAIVTYPDIALDPPFFDFGTIAPGTTKTLTFRILNNGDAPLIVSAIGVIMGNAFLLDPLPPFPLIVAPSSAASLNVVYSASPTPGQFNEGEFEVVSNDPDQPRIRLSLRGQADGPRIDVRPDFIDFHIVQQVPVSETVSIQNNGSSDLIVDHIVLEKGLDFSLQGLPPLPVTVTAGSQRTFQVRFQAQTVGSYLDTLIVNSNDARRHEVRNRIEARLVP
jgi:hypothetical protein